MLRESAIFEGPEDALLSCIPAFSEVPLMTSILVQRFILCKGVKAFKVRVVH